MVRYAQSRGHTVTLFNRGRTNTHLFPDVEKLRGDRDGDLAALEGGEWDAVIDNSGYVTRHVRDSAQLLSGAVGQYLFISTVSVYGDFATPNFDEDYPVGTLEDPTVEEVTGETYGPLKALCEQAVQEVFQDHATIVRPGYIVGPGDPSDRWTYWPVRVARGGEMIAPGAPSDPIQIIDARDLTRWTIQLVEQGTGGVFNGVGPETRMGMGDMLETARNTTGADAEFTWVSADFLQDQGAFFPIWNAPTGEYSALHQVDGSRARAAGLTYRPVAETVRDTLEWWNGQDAERQSQMRAGLRVGDMGFGPAAMEVVLEHETALLEAWHSREG
jgi:2'-hydroxyisoflavone reductase